MAREVSELFDASEWTDAASGVAGQRPAPGSPTSPTTSRSDGRIARIAFDRPEVRNAFRPHTVDELYRALDDARQNPRIGVVLLTGNGPSAKDGGWAFCSGGDQRIRGRDGYQYSDAETGLVEGETGSHGGHAAVGRLHILEVQRLIRFMPKVVIAVVPGWAAGGGHSLHVVCDLTIASREHGRFKQTDADVGSLRRRLRLAPTSPARSGRSSPARCSSSPRSTRAQRAYEMGAVNRSCRTPTSSARRSRWRARSSPSRRPRSAC